MFEDKYVSIGALDQHVVLFRRTAEELPRDESSLRRVYERMVEALPKKRTGLDLVLDARLAKGRNDAVFERVQSDFQERLFHGFGHLVALLNTPTGRLQVERYRREQPRGFIVLSELEQALELLREFRASEARSALRG